MKGTQKYNDDYEGFTKNVIAKYDPEGKYCLEGFYYSMLAGGKSPSTAYIYVGNVGKFIEAKKPEFNMMDVDTFTGYLITLRDKSSSVQINTYHSLQRYSKYLFAKKKIEVDFMGFIDKPKRVETEETREKREIGFLSQEEIPHFLDKIKELGSTPWESARNYAIVMVFLTTGIRRSALYKLDLRDFDPMGKTIRVIDKGNAHKRLSLTDRANAAVCAWLFYRERGVKKDGDALFLSVNGARIGSNTIYTTIEKAGNYIPGKHITPHKLRATFGTTLYDKTKDVYFVQQAMGHKSPQTTELYIRGHKASASQIASNLMGDIL